jgi:hypothetical protein
MMRMRSFFNGRSWPDPVDADRARKVAAEDAVFRRARRVRRIFAIKAFPA